MEDEVFYLSRPSILIAFIISFICFAIWCVSLPLSHYIPIPFEELRGIIMGFGGLMFSIIFGIFTLVAYNSKLRDFIGINRIIISGDGFLLYKKDGTIAKKILWQNIKDVEYQDLITRYYIPPLGEYRQLQSVKLNLIDGSTFEIPVDEILKESDHFRTISAIQYRVALQEQD
ncbi:MAG TPA: hypothetical protein VMW67_04520 [Desulfobacteria bacterium]|nr:hypothetical protein [Desulfobacteria bacterium]